MEDQISIKPLAEMVFIKEIVDQIRFIEIFAEQLNNKKNSDETWGYIQSILIAIANISKILWPSNKRYSRRGDSLRSILGISNDNPISDRKIRNHFEHYDERIDEWFIKNGSSTYIDKKIDLLNLTPFHHQTFSHRSYDPLTRTIYFRNESLELAKVFCALSEIREGCRKYGFKVKPIKNL